jgi:lysophospholipase L1-like esterase
MKQRTARGAKNCIFALLLLSLAFAAAAFLTGCGGGGQPASVPVTGVTVAEGASFGMQTGESHAFSAAVQPENAENRDVYWSIVGDAAGGGISGEGVLTAGGAAAQFTLRASSAADAARYADVAVSVFEAATGVAVVGDPVRNVLAGQTLQLSATVEPDGADAAVVWSIDGADAMGCSVNPETGLFTAGWQTASLTVRAASARNADLSASVTVEVAVPASGVEITEGAAKRIDALTTYTFNARVLPETATDTALVWSIVETGNARLGCSVNPNTGRFTSGSLSGAVTVRAQARGDETVFADIAVSVYVAVTDITIAEGVASGGGGFLYNLGAGRTREFHAVVTPAGATDPAVTWSIEGNPYGCSVAAGGAFTVGADTPVNTEIVLKAASADNPSIAARVTVTVIEAGTLEIMGASAVNKNFTLALAAVSAENGQTVPAAWEITAGGQYATIDAATGVLTGVAVSPAGAVTVSAAHNSPEYGAMNVTKQVTVENILSSVTPLATSNNFALLGQEADGVEVFTYRTYLKPNRTGEQNLKFLYGNRIDSTFWSDTANRYSGRAGTEFIIQEAYFALKTDLSAAPDGSIDAAGGVQVKFNGRTDKTVAPGEVFFSDSAHIVIPADAWLVFTWTVRLAADGVIPCQNNVSGSCFVSTASGAAQNGDGAGYTLASWPSGGGTTSVIVAPDLFATDLAYEKNIAFVGDSITQGVGTTVDAYENYAGRIGLSAEFADYAVWNLGLGWASAFDFTKSGNGWLDKAALYDEVVLSLATNDVAAAAMEAAVYNGLTDAIAKLKALNPSVKVILCTAPPFDHAWSDDPNCNAEKWARLNDYIRSSGVGAMGADYVFDIASVLSVPTEIRWIKSEYKVSANDAHPNGAGGAAVAGVFLPWYRIVVEDGDPLPIVSAFIDAEEEFQTGIDAAYLPAKVTGYDFFGKIMQYGVVWDAFDSTGASPVVTVEGAVAGTEAKPKITISFTDYEYYVDCGDTAAAPKRAAQNAVFDQAYNNGANGETWGYENEGGSDYYWNQIGAGRETTVRQTQKGSALIYHFTLGKGDYEVQLAMKDPWGSNRSFRLLIDGYLVVDRTASLDSGEGVSAGVANYNNEPGTITAAGTAAWNKACRFTVSEGEGRVVRIEVRRAQKNSAGVVDDIQLGLIKISKLSGFSASAAVTDYGENPMTGTTWLKCGDAVGTAHTETYRMDVPAAGEYTVGLYLRNTQWASGRYTVTANGQTKVVAARLLGPSCAVWGTLFTEYESPTYRLHEFKATATPKDGGNYEIVFEIAHYRIDASNNNPLGIERFNVYG